MAYKVFSNGDALTGSELNTYLMNQSVMVFASTTARDAALTAPTEGMVVWLQDANKYVYYTGSGAWADLIPQSGNAIINGAFEINQRNFTSSTNNEVFGFDRWKHNAVDGTTTFSSQTFTPGSAPAGYEAANYLRIVTTGQTLASARSSTQQLIEDVRSFAGQTITISFFAKAASGSPKIAVEIQQNFGSGGSATVLSYVGQSTVNTSWSRYSLTFSIPTVSGKTIGAGSYLGLTLFVSAGTDLNARTGSIGIQSNTFDIWGVQLEAGSVATSFKRNAPSIQAELAACQRYMEIIFSYDAVGIVKDSTTAYFNYYLKSPKRANPTISFKSTTYAFDITGITAKTGTAQNATLAQANLVVWSVSGSSGLTLGQHVSWNGGNIWVESEL